MSKTVKLHNASGIPLHRMSEEEIRELVTKLSEGILDSIPKVIRVAEVNSVKVESTLKESADYGVWAQWTRACCDKRDRIEEFTDPSNEELGITNSSLEKAVHQNHFDSNLSIRQVTEEASLKKIKGKNEK